MPKRIVWILGSGFSRPLDAPTLTELLSNTSRTVVQTIFPEKQFQKLYDIDQSNTPSIEYFRISYNLFDKGKLPVKSTYLPMWADAEQYLDYLDATATNSKSPSAARVISVLNRVFSSISKVDFQRLTDTTRRIIAAECSAFLQDKPTDLEIWQPYIRWANMLNQYHTIITFNYDRILETLSELRNCNIHQKSFFGITDYSHSYLNAIKSATVIKLHGSVDWKINASNVIERGNPLEALSCNSDQLVIATPGPTKHKMVSDILKELWDLAEDALRCADVVFFVGYRFPPTDTESLRRLSGALMINDSPDLRLYTVLGPNDDPDNRRLEALLNYALTQRKDVKGKVKRLPLWAQDFMSVCNPDFIFD